MVTNAARVIRSHLPQNIPCPSPVNVFYEPAQDVLTLSCAEPDRTVVTMVEHGDVSMDIDRGDTAVRVRFQLATRYFDIAWLLDHRIEKVLVSELV